MRRGERSAFRGGGGTLGGRLGAGLRAERGVSLRRGVHVVWPVKVRLRRGGQGDRSPSQMADCRCLYASYWTYVLCKHLSSHLKNALRYGKYYGLNLELT